MSNGQEWKCPCGAAGYEAAGSRLLEACPTCHAPFERRVTWTPIVGKEWLPLPDSKMPHGPGRVFKPDATGGGTLHEWKRKRIVQPRGFRKPRPLTQVVEIVTRVRVVDGSHKL